MNHGTIEQIACCSRGPKTKQNDGKTKAEATYFQKERRFLLISQLTTMRIVGTFPSAFCAQTGGSGTLQRGFKHSYASVQIVQFSVKNADLSEAAALKTLCWARKSASFSSRSANAARMEANSFSLRRSSSSYGVILLAISRAMFMITLLLQLL